MTNEERVPLKKVLGRKKAITKFFNGSELLFAFELNKYLKHITGKEIDFTSIKIPKGVTGSHQFSYVVENNMSLAQEYKGLPLKKYNKGFFFENSVEDITFMSWDNDLWVFSNSYEIDINRKMNGMSRSHALISLYAYLCIYRFLNNSDTKLVIENSKHNHLIGDYNDILILKNYGNMFVNDNICNLRMKEEKNSISEWVAHREMHMQRGFMDREYTIREKYVFATKNFAVGDVVLLYKRHKVTKSNIASKLESCYPAVIKAITQNGVEFQYYPITETKETRIYNLDRMNYQDVYNRADYNKFSVCTNHIDWFNLGVDAMLYMEENFFMPLIKNDGTYQVFTNQNGVQEPVWLNTIETVYAIFEDRGVSYNKNKFLKTYFSNGDTPLYDTLTLAKK